MGGIKKRRVRQPGFGLGGTPFNPQTGEYATLQPKGVFPYCALMQVAAEDTEVNYVVCRGWEPREQKFIDYEAGNDEKPGIAVAKPYAAREVGIYQPGAFHIAFLPMLRLGEGPQASQNPGVAATSTGQPADLQEEVEILYTSEGIVINWMFEAGDEPTVRNKKPKCTFTLSEELTISDASAAATITGQYGNGVDHDSANITVYNMPAKGGGYEFYGDSGVYGRASYTGEGTDWEIDILGCP